jgi:hypothetical protein
MIGVHRANDREEGMSETDERATMVHTLREEPGSYTRALENGAEVTYRVRPSDGGFAAEWEHVAKSGFGEETRRSHEEMFTSHADALRHLEENFDEPLTSRDP